MAAVAKSRPYREKTAHTPIIEEGVTSCHRATRTAGRLASPFSGLGRSITENLSQLSPILRNSRFLIC
jgi:hypothetical protein